jgi:hypothetical protein
VLLFQSHASDDLRNHWLFCTVCGVNGRWWDKNIWLGLSNLAFCDCSFYPARWRLRYAGWSLSDGEHPKDTTFGKAMKQHATEVAKA